MRQASLPRYLATSFLFLLFLSTLSYGDNDYVGLDTYDNLAGIGIVLSLDEDKIPMVISVIEGTPAFKTGIKARDRIIRIGGESTGKMTLEEVVKKLQGPKDSRVTMTLLRLQDKDNDSPKELEYTLARDEIRFQNIKWALFDGRIGYVRICKFGGQTAIELHEVVEKLKAAKIDSLILDLRSNPGGLLSVAADVADKFLESGRLIVLIESRHKDKSQRIFSKNEALLNPEIPMIVLVNGGSAGASEIVAGALKDWQRATVVGETTFGMGSVRSIISISNGSDLNLTTAKWLTPRGHSINGVGILPDIEERMSSEQLVHMLVDICTPDAVVDITQEEQDTTLLNGLEDVQLKRAFVLLQKDEVFEAHHDKKD